MHDPTNKRENNWQHMTMIDYLLQHLDPWNVHHCLPLEPYWWQINIQHLTYHPWTHLHEMNMFLQTSFFTHVNKFYTSKNQICKLLTLIFWIIQKIGFMRLWGSSFWFRLQSLKHCTYYHTTLIECFNSHLIHSIVKVQSPPCMQTC